MLLRLFGVAVGHLPKAAVSGQACSLIQQRQIKQTINNHAAPVLGVVQIPPRLDNSRLGEVPAAQCLSRFEKTRLRPGILLEQHRRVAGQRVEKTQVVGIQRAGGLHPLIEALQVFLQDGPINGVPGVFIEQPEHTGEKGSSPFKILILSGINQPFGIGGGKAIRKPGHHSRNFF